MGCLCSGGAKKSLTLPWALCEGYQLLKPAHLSGWTLAFLRGPVFPAPLGFHQLAERGQPVPEVEAVSVRCGGSGRGLVAPNLVTIHSCQLSPAGVSSFYSQQQLLLLSPSPSVGAPAQNKRGGRRPSRLSRFPGSPSLDSFLGPTTTKDLNKVTCLPRSLSLRRKRPRQPLLRPQPQPQLLRPPRNLPLTLRV